jgi:hypothetical protein
MDKIANREGCKWKGKLISTKKNDKVSFERRKLFGGTLIKGIIISCRFLNYNWVYLVECNEDKKLVVVPEEELWLLEDSNIE